MDRIAFLPARLVDYLAESDSGYLIDPRGFNYFL